jgi:hypothetical protein
LSSTSIDPGAPEVAVDSRLILANSIAIKEFQFALEHVEKMLGRRQTHTSVYISVNAGIATAVGLLLKDAQLSGEALWDFAW